MRTSVRTVHDPPRAVCLSRVRPLIRQPSSTPTSSSARGFEPSLPPQGLLAVAAYLPESWELRFVDENSARRSRDDLRWADVVSSPDARATPQIHAVIARPTPSAGRSCSAGPSVSGCARSSIPTRHRAPGRARRRDRSLIEYLDHHSGRPRSQLRFETETRLAARRLPDAGLRADPSAGVLIANIQSPAGVPTRASSALFRPLRRNPRLKTPEQICRELDVIAAPARRRSTSWTTTSSRTRRRPSISSPTWSSGSSGTGTRCASPARRH